MKEIMRIPDLLVTLLHQASGKDTGFHFMHVLATES